MKKEENASQADIIAFGKALSRLNKFWHSDAREDDKIFFDEFKLFIKEYNKNIAGKVVTNSCYTTDEYLNGIMIGIIMSERYKKIKKEEEKI